MKKMIFAVNIEEVDNGYVVRVGCKTLVFGARSDLLDELDAYMKGKPTPLTEQIKKEAMGGGGEMPNIVSQTCAPPQGCEPDRGQQLR